MVLTAGAMLSVWSVLAHTHTHTHSLNIDLVEAFLRPGGSGVGSSRSTVAGVKEHHVFLPTAGMFRSKRLL